jgi:hypothetical protein
MTPIVHAPAPTSRPPAGAAAVPENNAIVEQWLAMPHPDLTDHIRRLVRGGSMPSPVWTAVGTHPVLAARVRGILSALHSQMADHRDHAMWTLWINNARRALTSPPCACRKPHPCWSDRVADIDSGRLPATRSPRQDDRPCCSDWPTSA